MRTECQVYFVNIDLIVLAAVAGLPFYVIFLSVPLLRNSSCGTRNTSYSLSTLFQ